MTQCDYIAQNDSTNFTEIDFVNKKASASKKMQFPEVNSLTMITSFCGPMQMETEKTQVS